MIKTNRSDHQPPPPPIVSTLRPDWSLRNQKASPNPCRSSVALYTHPHSLTRPTPLPPLLPTYLTKPEQGHLRSLTCSQPNSLPLAPQDKLFWSRKSAPSFPCFSPSGHVVADIQGGTGTGPDWLPRNHQHTTPFTFSISGSHGSCIFARFPLGGLIQAHLGEDHEVF
jgi:hypothetical protein